MNSGEDICAHMTWTEGCGATQISCDSGYSSEGCWFGNYCIDSVNSWDSCPGMCSTMCNWDTEEWCDMGTDSNGCWMGNWSQPMEQGGCPDVNMVSKGDSWRNRRPWHTALTFGQTMAALTMAISQALDQALTMDSQALDLDLTMDSQTLAQALTKSCI